MFFGLANDKQNRPISQQHGQLDPLKYYQDPNNKNDNLFLQNVKSNVSRKENKNKLNEIRLNIGMEKVQVYAQSQPNLYANSAKDYSNSLDRITLEQQTLHQQRIQQTQIPRNRQDQSPQIERIRQYLNPQKLSVDLKYQPGKIYKDLETRLQYICRPGNRLIDPSELQKNYIMISFTGSDFLQSEYEHYKPLHEELIRKQQQSRRVPLDQSPGWFKQVSVLPLLD